MISGPDSTLRALQRHLEALHGIDTQLDIDHYSIGDDVRADFAGAIDGLVEQLFVRDDGDNVEMALYVAPQILQKLQGDDPCGHLHPGNFEAFCIALEGVSHFVFLAWRADLEWPVTVLEMELQAEVDKFVLSWLFVLSGRAHPALTADSLLIQLFGAWHLRPQVPQAERERYAVASRAAHNRCRKLVREAGSRPEPAAIMQAARWYFRRGLPDKLQAA